MRPSNSSSRPQLDSRQSITEQRSEFKTSIWIWWKISQFISHKTRRSTSKFYKYSLARHQIQQNRTNKQLKNNSNPLNFDSQLNKLFKSSHLYNSVLNEPIDHFIKKSEINLFCIELLRINHWYSSMHFV
jgi:hypothetical protein